MANVLILHPGSMGAAVAACVTANGHTAHWVSDGRSAATRARADDAGAIGYPTMAEAVDAADVVISVCPPDNALDVARAVSAAARETGTTPTFVDANAIAPITMAAVATEVSASGCPVVDGGIVGPPPTMPGHTRLFLSGEGTGAVAGLFEGSNVEGVVMDGEIGAASALKMAYAAWTKGSAALLLTIAAAAEAHGVADELHTEWDRSQPGTTQRLQATAARAASKAWRWEGEMQEIAATLAQYGLPAGFHLAASDTWRRLAEFKDIDHADPEAVLARLLAG